MKDGDEGGRDSRRLSRRAVLRATSGAVAASAIGVRSVRADPDADGGGGGARRAQFDRRCPDATPEPSHGYCAGASLNGCADDHEVTIDLREAVRETLTDRYPDAGALLDAGFKPYFDTIGGDSGYSHWLSTEYIGDDALLDPDRPESVLVDDESWRSIGVMFIATRGGDPVSPPPVVYDEDAGVTYEDELAPADPEPATEPGGRDGEQSANGGNGDHDHSGPDGPENLCSPWHYHAGLPGRFAWWYYRQVYERRFEEGDIRFPCRTPCMLHVWTVDHPESVYAHGAPPPEYREQEPAATAGFETDATPGEDVLGWDALPENLTPDRLPDDVSLPGV
ncbi:hypothetical protein [Halosolutus gelatinilyticus]|uniref:hypothetical protein n=1 Tax=Halosolutus gelatinilyticus TaxID=2931975 RepID=UPI001FF2AC17|nr:hypothetical protein [Halosolutus gelatinilyticus]